MNKQDYIESFVIEASIAHEGDHKMFVGFSMGVNSTCGSRDDYGQLVGLDYGSFGSPSFVEKIDD